MDKIIPSVLEFVPAGRFVRAQMQVLPPALIAEKMTDRWWKDPSLKDHFDPAPIDLDWDWNEMEIYHEGRALASEKVGVITDDAEIQGAMLISSVPVRSVLVESEQALFVEMLFTAPRNRSILRKDGQKYFGGVGPELLRWAAMFSEDHGFHGRLKLDASPDYLNWYLHLGFQKLNVEPVIFEGVQYTPLELPITGVRKIALDPKGARTST